MRKRGAQLLVQALEDAGVRFAFGIPGTHTIEIYDAFENSSIVPVLVTSELAASFMADGYARSSKGVGVLTVVPGAGVTMAMSGIAEAFMDKVAMVVIATGIRNDTGHSFQLHAIDQLAVLAPVTKATMAVERADQIYSTVRQALHLAQAGVPGPVAVEIPANLLMLTHEVDDTPSFDPGLPAEVTPDADLVEMAARLLGEAQYPAFYLGAGAAGAADIAIRLAEQIGAPVVTTIHGKGVFPEDHPLWLWNGFGDQAPPFVRNVMERCDCLLAVGCRFAEVATGSYGIKPPENLIHVDLDPEVFNRNYQARLVIEADALDFFSALAGLIEGNRPWQALAAEVSAGHDKVRHDLLSSRGRDRVNPDALYSALQRHCNDDAIFTVDSGNGAFLAMEYLRLQAPGRFLGPIDFSCMGYGVPASIGAAFAHPGRDVVATVGDGAVLMTGLEMLTAASYQAAPLVVVLRDGKLGQIAQFQQVPLNRETCSVLPDYSLEDMARAVGSAYFRLIRDSELDTVLPAALHHTRQGTPVVIEAIIDDRRKTYFTKGVLKTNFLRFSWPERLRVLLRAVARRLPM